MVRVELVLSGIILIKKLGWLSLVLIQAVAVTPVEWFRPAVPNKNGHVARSFSTEPCDFDFLKFQFRVCHATTSCLASVKQVPSKHVWINSCVASTARVDSRCSTSHDVICRVSVSSIGCWKQRLTKVQSCLGQWWTRSGSCPMHRKHWKSTRARRSPCCCRKYWWSSLIFLHNFEGKQKSRLRVFSSKGKWRETVFFAMLDVFRDGKRRSFAQAAGGGVLWRCCCWCSWSWRWWCCGFTYYLEHSWLSLLQLPVLSQNGLYYLDYLPLLQYLHYCHYF